MGQILHRSATTTEAIRRAIQHSQESLRTLSRRHGINPKTVAKWRKRSSTANHRTGPTVPRFTVLSIEQEAIIVAFRKHTLLPLDDCLYALQATIPQLTRSSLHRCLERHGIGRLPEVEGEKPRRPRAGDGWRCRRDGCNEPDSATHARVRRRVAWHRRPSPAGRGYAEKQ